MIISDERITRRSEVMITKDYNSLIIIARTSPVIEAASMDEDSYILPYLY